jgi:hypothetical protein
VKPNATFLAKYMTHAVVSVSSNVDGGCCGCDRIGITTTYAINAYHH